jgi:hypothetical protein
MNRTLVSEVGEPAEAAGAAGREGEVGSGALPPPDPADTQLLERDRAARKAAQTVFDRPLVLQAGAGTGKTTTLVGRLLAWALGPGWEGTAMRRAARAAANPF